MGIRDTKPMVSEDDPQFRRFWDAYPYRVSKKDARHAWTQLNPDVALVDRMLVTLAWQAVLWETQGFGMPYPASWLRGERWTDEPMKKKAAPTGNLLDAAATRAKYLTA